MQTRLSETIEFNGMRLDVAGHSLLDDAGRDVKLTRGEFAILTALLRRPGQVLSRDQLLDAVSGRGADAFDRSIDNLVSRLRRKIEPDPRKPRLIVSVRGVGYKFSPRPEAGKALSPVRAVSQCSILVAPFANLSGGRELSHFAAAVSTNLTSGLRHVVGAEPVCAVDAAAGVHRSGQAGTHYILRGWVRRSRRQIRLDAQMIDAWTGAPVWAERFDGKFADMFALEGEISARIVRGIDLELVIAESRNGPDRAGDLNIQDLVTRGYADLYRPRTARNLASARHFFERVLRVDDRNAEALAGLAHTHVSDILCRWSANPDLQVRLADEGASRALETNARLAYAYHVRGLVSRVRREHERARTAFDTAVQINPSLAPAHAELGFAKNMLNGVENGLASSLDAVALARRISPAEPVLANWLYGIGVNHLKIGENAKAIRWLNESIGLHPLPPALAYLAAAYALIGDDGRARSALCEFGRVCPCETLRTFEQRVFADHQILPGSRVFEGLRKAGLQQD
jgi:adenylate cyclase